MTPVLVHPICTCGIRRSHHWFPHVWGINARSLRNALIGKQEIHVWVRFALPESACTSRPLQPSETCCTILAFACEWNCHVLQEPPLFALMVWKRSRHQYAAFVQPELVPAQVTCFISL